jgi:hypothetical protein
MRRKHSVREDVHVVDDIREVVWARKMKCEARGGSEGSGWH